MARGRLAEFFPLPFVGATVLLVVLIFLTPNLLFTGRPAAGTLATQAELTIDVPPGTATMHFYVGGLTDVRYAVMHAYVASNLSWSPPPAVANITWTNVSYETEALATGFQASGLPVALNLSVTYVDTAGSAVTYWGVYEFDIQNAVLLTAPLDPRLPNVASAPVSSLPITILLEAEPGAGIA